MVNYTSCLYLNFLGGGGGEGRGAIPPPHFVFFLVGPRGFNFCPLKAFFSPFSILKGVFLLAFFRGGGGGGGWVGWKVSHKIN